MSLEKQLKGLVDAVEGARAAVLMGLDGIPVSEARSAAYSGPLQDVAVEFSRILSEVTRIGQGNDLGATSELVFGLDSCRVVLRPIDHQYFLFFLLDPSGNVGKARFALRRAAPDVRSEL